MHEFVGEIGLFLWAVIAHWQSYVTGGVVTAGVGIYERRSGKNIPWKLYATLFFLSAGIVAVFYAWHDEHHNTRVVIEEKANAVGVLGECRGDLKSAAAQNTLLQSQVGSQQTTINNQQTNLTAMQQGVNAQQSTVNSCVVGLTKINTPEPQKSELQREKIDLDPEHGKHLNLFVLTTNKPVTPISFAVRCDADIKWIHSHILGTGIEEGSGPKLPPDKKTYSFVTTRPAMDERHPLLVWVGFDAADLGACTFTPQG
jgi:hypothetical protein